MVPRAWLGRSRTLKNELIQKHGEIKGSLDFTWKKLNIANEGHSMSTISTNVKEEEGQTFPNVAEYREPFNDEFEDDTMDTSNDRLDAVMQMIINQDKKFTKRNSEFQAMIEKINKKLN